MTKKKSKRSGKKKKAVLASRPGLFATLTQTARLSRNALDRALSTAGLHAGQEAVLLVLDAEDGRTPSAIAAELGVRAPTITKTINRLAAQGFVVKQASQTDGRLSHIHLSGAGRNAMASVRKAVGESEAAAAAGMSGKDVKALVKLLHKVGDNLYRTLDDAVVGAAEDET